MRTLQTELAVRGAPVVGQTVGGRELPAAVLVLAHEDLHVLGVDLPALLAAASDLKDYEILVTCRSLVSFQIFFIL